MLVGFARVSAQEQETHAQTDALREAGVGFIFAEKRSGGSASKRPNCPGVLGTGSIDAILDRSLSGSINSPSSESASSAVLGRDINQTMRVRKAPEGAFQGSIAGDCFDSARVN
jgi:hypothetical protein